MNIDQRINQINDELAALERERSELEAKLRSIKEDKWSEEGLRERLRKAILSRYGSVHNIKMAVLRLNGVYNDEYNDYESPSLILIDADFNEVKHDISAYDFVPSGQEQRDYWREGRRPICEAVTLKF